MLSETLQVITQVAMLVFVVGSMAAMGLGLTVARIAQPLRDLRLVVALLVVNFVVVPAAAIAAARLLPMEPAAATAVVLIGCVGGAPFLPKLAQLAKSNPRVDLSVRRQDGP
jgi:BASS family bile acid:Na+ symporter